MNKQQKFLSALVALCKEYDVEVSVTVHPVSTNDSAKPDSITANISCLAVEQNTLRPWSERMAVAYQAGVEDAHENTARPQRANGFDACYWQGWTRGLRRGSQPTPWDLLRIEFIQKFLLENPREAGPVFDQVMMYLEAGDEAQARHKIMLDSDKFLDPKKVIQVMDRLDLLDPEYRKRMGL